MVFIERGFSELVLNNSRLTDKDIENSSKTLLIRLMPSEILVVSSNSEDSVWSCTTICANIFDIQTVIGEVDCSYFKRK